MSISLSAVIRKMGQLRHSMDRGLVLRGGTFVSSDDDDDDDVSCTKLATATGIYVKYNSSSITNYSSLNRNLLLFYI